MCRCTVLSAGEVDKITKNKRSNNMEELNVIKNKHLLFSISLSLAVFVIMILSLWGDNDVFQEIAEVIALPFLLFTLAGFILSFFEEISSIASSQQDLEKTKIQVFKAIADDYNMRYNVPEVENDDSCNESVQASKNIRKYVDENKEAIHNCNLKIDTYKHIETWCYNNKVIPTIYVFSLTLLIVSMMMHTILLQWFSFGHASTVTFASLFLAMGESLVKKPLADALFKVMVKRHSKSDKIKEKTNRYQTIKL